MPAADRLMTEHPNVQIEISIDQQFVDIAQEGFDAGIRLGESLDQGMIGLRIGPDLK